MPSTEMVETRQVLGTRITRLPALLRGELVLPPWPSVGEVTRLLRHEAPHARPITGEGSYLLAQPLIDRTNLTPTGETAILVLPALDPRALPEPDPAAAITSLMRLTPADVGALVNAVRGALLEGAARELLPLLSQTSTLGDRAHRAFAAQVPHLFDPDTVIRTIARVPASGGALGWADVDETPVHGAAARMAGIAPIPGRRPVLRPVPTRQLHITAGNAAVVPLASLLWGWCTRGACVVKASAEACAVPSIVGAAIAAAPDHPLAARTTLTYWPGGDRRVEDVVLAPGAFERRLVWGSQQAVDSIVSRGAGTETIVMRPRHSVSLIDRTALDDLPAVVTAAAADSLVANQAACMSSLCHVVVGTAGDADRYAQALCDELARWDIRLPHQLGADAQQQLVALRRGALAGGRWLVNGTWPQLGSAVVRHDGYTDLRHHPGSRLVIVAAAVDVDAFLRRLGPDVSSVGVAPEPLRHAVRDAIVARGIDNVLPLGCAEEGYPGRPHDGMDVLPRLVRWVNG